MTMSNLASSVASPVSWVARGARLVERERGVGAAGDAGDGDLAAPPAELDHERDVAAAGDVGERELAVGAGGGGDQRRAGGGRAALVAGDAGGERLHGAVGDVDERVVERVGRAVERSEEHT